MAGLSEKLKGKVPEATRRKIEALETGDPEKCGKCGRVRKAGEPGWLIKRTSTAAMKRVEAACPKCWDKTESEDPNAALRQAGGFPL